MLYVDCFTTLPSVFFMFDWVWLELSGAELVNDVSVAQDGSMCAVAFVPNVDDVWILGHALFNGYYVSHKPEALLMLFAPNELLQKNAPRRGTIPTKSLPKKASYWGVVMARLIVGGGLAAGYWALITYYLEPTSWTGFSFLNSASRKVKYEIKTNRSEKKRKEPDILLVFLQE